jgi:hypothetical protein
MLRENINWTSNLRIDYSLDNYIGFTIPAKITQNYGVW